MIATIRGKVTELSDNRLIIEIGGIGYEVNVSSKTLQSVDAGESIKLYIHEHRREDLLELYGFNLPEDKLRFELLLSVNGVGPRMALAIVSQVSDLSKTIGEANTMALQAVAGVGKKLAERIVVELRNRLDSSLSGLPGSGQDDEALAALIQLGYSSKQAQTALAKASKAGTTEEKIKIALQELGRG